MNLGSAARKAKRKAAVKAAPKDALRSQLRETVTATILDAAEARFASQGLHGASLAEIAKAAGVAVGTLYNYFADREALVAALLETRRETMRAQLIAALDAGKDQEFEPRLREFTRAMFGIFESLRSYMKIMFQAEHLKHHGKTDIFTMVEQQIVGAGVAEGVIEKRDAETFVTLYTGSIRSVIVRSLANDTSFVDKADAICTMLLDGAPEKTVSEVPTLSPATVTPQVGKWTVAVSVAFGSMMASIDTSIVNVAIPQIRGQLGASLQEITWITTAYMIAMVLVMPLTGFLGSFFGQKRVYLLSLIIFTAGSVLCGTARSLEMLVLWRIVQGLGGGALQPTQQAILRQTFPPQEQAMAMAVFAMVIMIGPAVGPVLGGYITDNMSWPWIFFVNLPVGILGIYLTFRNVHEPADVLVQNRARAEVMKKNLDYAGIILMALAVGAMMYVLEEGAGEDWFDSQIILGMTFFAVVATVAFVIRELTAVAPVIDLRMFRDPTFASGTVIAGIMYAMLMGSMFLLPVFTQELMKFTATQSGIVLMPRTIAMMIASPIVGKLYSKIAPAWLCAIGLVLTSYGCWLQATINLQTATADLILPLAVTGFGFAFLFVPLTTAALSNVPRAELAGAAGVNSFVRQIGGSIGLSIFATLFTRFSTRAAAGISSNLSVLRPEVLAQATAQKVGLLTHGLSSDMADAVLIKQFGGRAYLQGTVIGFDKTFVLQTVAFLVIMPLLFFLRVKPTDGPVHVEISAE